MPIIGQPGDMNQQEKTNNQNSSRWEKNTMIWQQECNVSEQKNYQSYLATAFSVWCAAMKGIWRPKRMRPRGWFHFQLLPNTSNSLVCKYNICQYTQIRIQKGPLSRGTKTRIFHLVHKNHCAAELIWSHTQFPMMRYDATYSCPTPFITHTHSYTRNALHAISAQQAMMCVLCLPRIRRGHHHRHSLNALRDISSSLLKNIWCVRCT